MEDTDLYRARKYEQQYSIAYDAWEALRDKLSGARYSFTGSQESRQVVLSALRAIIPATERLLCIEMLAATLYGGDAAMTKKLQVVIMSRRALLNGYYFDLTPGSGFGLTVDDL